MRCGKSHFRLTQNPLKNNVPLTQHFEAENNLQTDTRSVQEQHATHATLLIYEESSFKIIFTSSCDSVPLKLPYAMRNTMNADIHPITWQCSTGATAHITNHLEGWQTFTPSRGSVPLRLQHALRIIIWADTHPIKYHSCPLTKKTASRMSPHFTPVRTIDATCNGFAIREFACVRMSCKWLKVCKLCESIRLSSMICMTNQFLMQADGSKILVHKAFQSCKKLEKFADGTCIMVNHQGHQEMYAYALREIMRVRKPWRCVLLRTNGMAAERVHEIFM